jgi:endoglucanase
MKANLVSCVCASACLLVGGHGAHTETLTESQVLFSRGMSLAGAEFNPERNPATYGTDYIYPPLRDLDYFAGKGFAVVRLPYRWERLQPSLFQKLDEAELGRIKKFVAAAHDRKMRVILSPHNFGRYLIDGEDKLIGSASVPIEAFADFSYKVAAAFRADPGIYALSLMNEPHDSEGLWKLAAQTGLDAIRVADRERLVLAPGDQWSGAWSWRRYNEDFVLNDSTGRLMYEAHQYFDLDHSGNYKLSYTAEGASPERAVEWVRPFAEWLKLRRAKGILTEFGVPDDDPRWLALAGRLLAYLAKQGIPWTYWAAGPWWANYRLSAEPKNGIDAPIMPVLVKDYATTQKTPSGQ